MPGVDHITSDWDPESDGVMSEDTIRHKLDHPERYRISRHRYPPGTSFSGTARAGMAYVIQGACRYAVDAYAIVLRSGQYREVPEGEFRFEVTTNDEVDLVRVWLLPEALWGSQREG